MSYSYTHNNTDLYPSNPVLCNVDLPFNTYELEEPVVTGVDPTSEQAGQTFEIQGRAFYPELVTAVLLGGESLPTGNWTATTDTQIAVVVPGDIGTGAKAVGVQTSEGNSNTDVSITIEDP